jgi:tetratricopeptide (TPR) repeat protein
MDHYAALELRSDAPPEAVAEAWRMVRELYSTVRAAEDPHLADCEGALDEITARAASAFQVLYDPMARRRYDEVRASLEPSPEMPDPTGEIPVIERPAAADADGAGATDEKAADGFCVDEKPLNEVNQARLERAEDLIRSGDHDQAIRLMEKVCAIQPRPDVLLKLARLLFDVPRWTNRALTTLRTALECDPAYVPAWVELAEFWTVHGRKDRVRKAVNRALAVDPDHPRAREILGELEEQDR